MTRCESFELLRNIKLTSWLDRTKMCPRLEKYGECRIEKCRYAHTRNELKLTYCIFGEKCKYKDSKTRPCTYIHPIEAFNDFEKTGTSLFTYDPVTVLNEDFIEKDIDILLNRLKNECEIENYFYKRENPSLIRCTKDVLGIKLNEAFQRGIKTITFSPID
jgi:hypothetical protein